MTPDIGTMAARMTEMARDRDIRPWSTDWYGWRFEIPLSWYALVDQGTATASIVAPPERFWLFGYPASVDATLPDDGLRLVQS